MTHKFKVGDRVRIRCNWWSLGRPRYAKHDGKDALVTTVLDNGMCHTDCEESPLSWFENELELIKPADEPAVDEPENTKVPPFIEPPNKYYRKIRGLWINSDGETCDDEMFADVYAIGAAYELTPPLVHALKKLLMAGQRGHKDREQDLREAIDSIERELRGF